MTANGSGCDIDAGAHADLARGARLFDAGEHFEAHEVWEERWRASTDETDRRFFQGLIQIAAGLHKRLAMGAPEPARRLLERGLAKLEACPARLHGLDVAALCARVRACLPVIEHLDRDAAPRIGAIDDAGG